MIDLLQLSIPFKSEHVIETLSADEQGGRYIDLEEIARRTGLRLTARDVEFEISGDLQVTGLSHPYESLPSHFASLAMKVHQGSNLAPPRVELKASPAKLLQGHNVFGPTDVSLCAEALFTPFCMAMPLLADYLDFEETSVAKIDSTFSARLKTINQTRQVMDVLRNVSNGQTKATKSTRSQNYDSTVYWNETSNSVRRKAYLKGQEIQADLERCKMALRRSPNDESLKRRINILSNPDLIEWAALLIRFEVSLFPRKLHDLNIPTKLFDLISYQIEYEKEGRNLIYDMWSAGFNELFESFKGTIMNIYDDEKILELLKLAYHSTTPKGNITYSKAQRIFGFYRRLVNEGYDEVFKTIPRKSFYRNINELISAGISKAQLQNLQADKKNNVIPLVQLIQVDFSKQYPDWYVEPVSPFNNVIQLKAS
ncbi:DNA replication protein [Salmonella enterica]|uniref:DNA replication protein n=1 Tax=Salmonella enterica subsp. enterica serovar Panama TaxID=29472 RepID=A0A5U8JBT0_SALET|nr:phage/plasmid replication protein, II/X family [Salmonella enterica]EBP4092519.1 DNA replication protein [Salmonella enterica subsp. enterica]EBR7995552.1 DNA replication protein [Salmonella enterica subsp. enterica serovar Panama]ECV7107554.1 DNA replication protein [Salmonella enterica subsp. enterica serovar Newport]EDS7004747.1 DNA replication protein [Salmonella enterica subsp. diarizonae]ASD86761.1 DNA replication protein [Salmonella enterica subsp. enterica serovar India str. SA20085